MFAIPTLLSPNWTVSQWTQKNTIDFENTPYYEFKPAYFIPTFYLTFTTEPDVDPW